MKIKAINFNERQLDMADEIMQEKGLPSFTAVIHFALAQCHGKIKPAYLSIGKRNQTPEERAKFSVDVKLAKKKHTEDIKFTAKKKICEDVLGGEVFKDASGGNSCRYFVYDIEKDEEQILPLDMVNEGYHKHQFFPDKETVMKKRPDVRKKFTKK